MQKCTFPSFAEALWIIHFSLPFKGRSSARMQTAHSIALNSGLLPSCTAKTFKPSFVAARHAIADETSKTLRLQTSCWGFTFTNGKPSECHERRHSHVGQSCMGLLSMQSSPNTNMSNSPKASILSTIAFIGRERAFLSIAHIPTLILGRVRSSSAIWGSCRQHQRY